jgi:hypothetical protein
LVEEVHCKARTETTSILNTMLFGKNTVTACNTEAEKYCSLQTESHRLTSEESKLPDGHSLIAAPESCKGLASAAQA